MEKNININDKTPRPHQTEGHDEPRVQRLCIQRGEDKLKPSPLLTKEKNSQAQAMEMTGLG